jgi:hypothetical protein
MPRRYSAEIRLRSRFAKLVERRHARFAPRAAVHGVLRSSRKPTFVKYATSTLQRFGSGKQRTNQLIRRSFFMVRNRVVSERQSGPQWPHLGGISLHTFLTARAKLLRCSLCTQIAASGLRSAEVRFAQVGQRGPFAYFPESGHRKRLSYRSLLRHIRCLPESRPPPSGKRIEFEGLSE